MRVPSQPPKEESVGLLWTDYLLVASFYVAHVAFTYPGNRYRLNCDSMSYIGIAEKYAQGTGKMPSMHIGRLWQAGYGTIY